MNRRRFVVAACAGAAIAVCVPAGAANALPQYHVERSVDGDGAHAKVFVYEQTGEFDYYRRVVGVDADASGAHVTYEKYDTNFYDTTETDGSVTAGASGIEHGESTDYWGADHQTSGQGTAVDADPSGGVGAHREETLDGCGPATDATYDPAADPATGPTVSQTNSCEEAP